MKRKWLWMLLLPLVGCEGTDLVEEPVGAEEVRISPARMNFEVGDEQAFQATYFNDIGFEEPASFSWLSSDTAVVQVDQDGVLFAKDTGKVEVLADANGITGRMPIRVYMPGEAPDDLLTNERSGTFVSGASSYFASGSAALVRTPSGRLELQFGSDFATSAGPSVYVFLANKTAGPYAFLPGGNEINGISAQLTRTKLTTFTGAMTFAVPDGVGIHDYDYAVLYCILGPVFGYAKLQ